MQGQVTMVTIPPAYLTGYWIVHFIIAMTSITKHIYMDSNIE